VESKNDHVANHLIYDYRLAPLEGPDRALCDFAAKPTLVPSAVSEADITRLRQSGFTDDQLGVAVQVIGYFNYINRVAEGLGVDPEPWMTPSAGEWRKRKAKRRTIAESFRERPF